MMKAKYILAVCCMLVITACQAQQYKFVGTFDPTAQAMTGVVRPDGNSSGGTCPSVPSNFNETDLVGTWEYFDNSRGELALILSADNTYKQIYDYAPNNYHYEGEWKKWRLERRINGTGLVIFQDMWFCEVDCIPLRGGAVTDPCDQYKTVPLNNKEVALVLMGAPPPNDPELSIDSPIIALRGIQMIDPPLDPDSTSIIYRLKR
jgi:hypothetical protein